MAVIVVIWFVIFLLNLAASNSCIGAGLRLVLTFGFIGLVGYLIIHTILINPWWMLPMGLVGAFLYPFVKAIRKSMLQDDDESSSENDKIT